ncbi:CwfJ domain-containing protein [Cryomyces antarcticus]
MSSKILVVGEVNGQFPAVFSKISTLHTKNSFALAIIVGDLFADPQTSTSTDDQNITALISGKIDLPLPVYFMLGRHRLPEQIVQRLESDAGEICSNLYFLGKRTTIKTSEGIRIVSLGGVLDPSLPAGVLKDKYQPTYSEDDAKTLRGANSADILVTSQWPANIRTGSKVDFGPDGGQEPDHQQCVADLCASLKPRYHFSTSNNTFFEREPFFHAPTEAAPDGYPITRFISLASYNNPKKQKWIYAFSIDPTAAPAVVIPPGTTASPLSLSNKKRPTAPSQEFSRFSTDGAYAHRGNKRRRAAPPTPAECFFCLSSPNLATHLITSIGTDAYLTTAKGPLSTSDTYPSLGFPSHILIIPLTHSPTLASIADAEARKNTYDEMQRYRQALHDMLTKLASCKLGAVTWEVSRAGGVHTHWQFLPVPVDSIRRGLVEAAFKVEAENERYPNFETKDVGDGTEESSDFFRALIWAPPSTISGGEADGDDGSAAAKNTSLLLPLDASFRFDLQFGRRVLAKLLGLGGRMHWQDCGQSEEDETADAEAFKKAFKEFDFALEG